jgi:hypothetical protein
VSGDPRYAQAGPELVGDVVGKPGSETGWNDYVLGGGAEGPIGLRTVNPHSLSQAALIDPVSDFVDRAGGVAVRNDERIRHRRAEPTVPFLRVARIHARKPHANPNLTGAGMRVLPLPHMQDIVGGTLTGIPGS